MTWKKKNSERLKKRIINLSLSFGGMTQAEIAKKVHRSPVYVSRVLKKYDEHIRIQMMDLDKAMEILKTLSGWELCLLLRTVERMKNYDAAVYIPTLKFHHSWKTTESQNFSQVFWMAV